MSASYDLADIFLGVNDGKKEALLRNDFERYFYNYNRIYNDTVKREKFLVLGRKGTGKTILAEYIKKKHSQEEPWKYTCDIISFKEFRFHELIELKNSDIKPNEYISIWEWVILLIFGKNILNDESIAEHDLKTKLEKFFADNHYSLDIDSKKIIELTKNSTISGNILRLLLGASSSTKLSVPMYLNYLEDLRNVVIKLLCSSQRSYYVFFDELDDRFRNDELYRNGLISLIKAADKINNILLEKNVESKIYLLLRTDIFAILNDPDLNKIKMIQSVSIDWGRRADNSSPLISMILLKIRVSLPELAQLDDEQLFSKIFPQKINGIHPARFLLERTFFRPRDVITYLNLIIEKVPRIKYFGRKHFVETKADYSAYFFNEVRNELSGHLADEEIDKGVLLLKQFNRFHFSYKEIATYFCQTYPSYKSIDLDRILRVFFKFSIIGNKWLNEYKRKTYYSWAYRDNRAELDLNKSIVVHLGLREELSM